MRTKYSVKTMKVWILLAIVILLILWRYREPFDEENPPPVCPAGTILGSDDKCSSAVLLPFECPEGYDRTPQKNCKRTGGTETKDPQCPAGNTFSTELGWCITTPVDPSCPGDFKYKEGKCVRKGTTSSSPVGVQSNVTASTPATTPSASQSNVTARTTGTTTGGQSTSSLGPNSGGPTGGRNRQVFGPVFTERDQTKRVGPAGDSSKSNVYPELLGGMPDTSTRIPGAGITEPSKNWTLAMNGSLPSAASLGSEELSKFFPMSRQPGDMDIIPDPYRLSRNFSTSSYSSKTEPVPFLTDFSAFLK